MDCNDARPLIDANVDRELSPPDAHALQQHIDRCAACQRESDAVRALSAAVRTAAQYHRAPQALRARIIGALPATGAGLQREETSRSAAERNDGEYQGTSRGATRGETAQTPRGGRRDSPSSRRWLDFLRGKRPASGEARESGWGPVRGGAPVALPFGAAWRGGALALAVCAAVAAGVLYTQQRVVAPSGLVDELVSSHVRAQISGRDIDVISSDQHTVKPWFNGRIDYAPPVVDLKSSGFALAGGRLDYVGHRRVAVLTYMHAKHVIDVYVFPDNDPAAGKPGPSLSSDGYSLARWRDAGMMWWAVTDAAPESLTQLEAAMRARLQNGTETGDGS
ncbi:anti-sigma factor family protein [Paraburkholderia rhizosphaerae]|uniref:Anti-sigma factor (TIGR02949 family) n=1 Tax=Paraburkholderia rhizosphaerae TaxID=480658 RepID=A0A4R8LXL7_9BURK|nr:zf-HC2 domain-containing protein [Paraburkholderia rhizosphaerae]TDY52976.1 anti-sigma factor (TIGR02949 family) [Paraburkholderia rhizosphaerae]